MSPEQTAIASAIAVVKTAQRRLHALDCYLESVADIDDERRQLLLAVYEALEQTNSDILALIGIIGRLGGRVGE